MRPAACGPQPMWGARPRRCARRPHRSTCGRPALHRNAESGCCRGVGAPSEPRRQRHATTPRRLPCIDSHRSPPPARSRPAPPWPSRPPKRRRTPPATPSRCRRCSSGWTADDGTLTRAEAEANPRVAEIYDSLDTGENIENPSTNAPAEGINFNQFEAGMTADREGKGTVGLAASGGETHPDVNRRQRHRFERLASACRGGGCRDRSAAAPESADVSTRDRVP